MAMTDDPDEHTLEQATPDEWFEQVWADLGPIVHAEMLKRGMTKDEFKVTMLRKVRKLNA